MPFARLKLCLCVTLAGGLALGKVPRIDAYLFHMFERFEGSLRIEMYIGN